MCLYYSPQMTVAVRKRLEKGPITAWKVMKKRPLLRVLTPQFFYRTRRDAVGSPRIVRSSRRAAGLPARRYPGMLVNKGAHVYLRKSDAVRRAAYDGGTVVVPVRVRLKHFVAAEGWTRRLFGDGYFHHGQAVFTQYRILKKDWDAIFNQ